MGSVPQGQGHETSASQVVADALNITPALVNVRPGFDTAHNAYTGHTGTYASQFEIGRASCRERVEHVGRRDPVQTRGRSALVLDVRCAIEYCEHSRRSG